MADLGQDRDSLKLKIAQKKLHIKQLFVNIDSNEVGKMEADARRKLHEKTIKETHTLIEQAETDLKSMESALKTLTPNPKENG